MDAKPVMDIGKPGQPTDSNRVESGSITRTLETLSRHFRASDIRAAIMLAVQATRGVTGIVEGVHQSVTRTMGIREGAKPGQTSGIPGLVYRIIHGGAQIVGSGANEVLSRLEPIFDPAPDHSADSLERAAIVAALNGVIGDHLADSNNPLATAMSFRYQGKTLDWNDLATVSGAGGKVLLLVHGLCMNDLMWLDSNGNGHGEMLASALGYSPVYLCYNSGLHIAHNGQELSRRLEQLVAHWPVSIDELTIVAHSMGGLLARSATHHARQQSLDWVKHLKNIVFLGTPHHGAPLERGGSWLDLLMGATPYSRPFTTLARIRSAGVTDLRYGHVTDEGVYGDDRFSHRADNRRYLPLPEGVSCYTVAATMAAKRGKVADRLLGDGLVPLPSALGQHEDPGHHLGFESSDQWIAYRTNHQQLLGSPEVTRQIVQWLTPKHPA